MESLLGVALDKSLSLVVDKLNRELKAEDLAVPMIAVVRELNRRIDETNKRIDEVYSALGNVQLTIADMQKTMMDMYKSVLEMQRTMEEVRLRIGHGPNT